MCTAHPATHWPSSSLPHWVPSVCFRTPSLLITPEKGGLSVGPNPEAQGQWLRPSCFPGGPGTSPQTWN